jgi:chemotaxis protein methyltransferase CheR
MIGPDFDNFRRLVLERSGLVLGPEKAYLLKARLEPIVRSEGVASVEELLQKLRFGMNDALLDRCVEALATHESSFFRDGAPFEALKKSVLPELANLRSGVRRIRIWCAACSSGQEPYSIAMVAKELGQKLSGFDVEIVATDFSPGILAKAKAGLYSDFEVRRGLTDERRADWFTKESGGWRVSQELRQMVSFRHHNLLQPMNEVGAFDVVFCRNVLIYFDAERKQQVLASVASAMAHDAWLFLGSAESLMGLPPGLTATGGAHGLCRRTGLFAA